MEKTNQWADIFPGMRSQPTTDPRIFHTSWKKEKNTKVMTYFCCVVGKNCYGVDVIRPLAGHSEEKRLEAFQRVQIAANYYEEHNTWPGKHIIDKIMENGVE